MITLQRIAIVVCLIFSHFSHGATIATPGAQTPVATGSVSGVVLSDESPAQPVRRATVSLLSADLRVPQSAVTDDSGRFTLSGVPAGHYSLVASKPAYVGTFYGSKRPGRGPGVPVAVPAGARVTDLRLTLTRGSVIAGTLRLPGGQPALNMPITAVEIETVNGVRRLRLTGGRTTTDDRGEFRVFGLTPGEYIVQAQPSGLLSGALTAASDARQTTAAEVSWAQETAKQRAGSPLAAAPAAPAPERGRTMNYATVFFPGTPDPSAAALVRVGPGEERTGVDFALALVPTARLSGVVFGPDGQPMPNASVALITKDDGLGLANLLAPRAPIRSGADGSFAIPGVAPGRYQLAVRSTAPADANAGPGALRPGVRTLAAAASASAGGADLWAQQDVVVDGQEIANMALAMERGMTAAGRLVFGGPPAASPTPEQLAGARVTFSPASTTGGAAGALASGTASVSATVAADGTFVVTGLAPNRYRVSVSMPGLRTTTSAPGAGWSLASIMYGGIDAADRALDIRPRENAEGVVISFTDRPAELSGALLDEANRPAPGYPIVVFSADRTYWIAGSRRVVAARPSTDGTFRLAGLPAGTYYLCAVVSLDQSDLDDPAFLDQLVAGALTITLTEGGKVTQNLRLAPR